MGQHQRRIEPLADRQHGSPLPFEHRFEKLVLAARAHRRRIDAIDRLIEQRLQLIAKLRVAKQVIDFFRLGRFGSEHECHGEVPIDCAETREICLKPASAAASAAQRTVGTCS